MRHLAQNETIEIRGTGSVAGGTLGRLFDHGRRETGQSQPFHGAPDCRRARVPGGPRLPPPVEAPTLRSSLGRCHGAGGANASAFVGREIGEHPSQGGHGSSRTKAIPDTPFPSTNRAIRRAQDLRRKPRKARPGHRVAHSTTVAHARMGTTRRATPPDAEVPRTSARRSLSRLLRRNIEIRPNNSRLDWLRREAHRFRDSTWRLISVLSAGLGLPSPRAG